MMKQCCGMGVAVCKMERGTEVLIERLKLVFVYLMFSAAWFRDGDTDLYNDDGLMDTASEDFVQPMTQSLLPAKTNCLPNR